MRTIKEIFRFYAVFDEQGRHVNGTDKESNHSYGNTYESIFYDRAALKLVMEVGVADGSSLLAWREVFPNATTVGLDIHPSERANGDRIQFYLGDATQRMDCERAVADRWGKFDLIVDDATHRIEDILRTLFYLWPAVKPGGHYVIEEFDGVQSLRRNIEEMWPGAFILGTCGPQMRDEPLVVLRKSL